MNNDLEQFSEERLKAWISDDPNKIYHVDGEDLQYLARIALSVKQAKPVGKIVNNMGGSASVKYYEDEDELPDGTALYTTPQPAHTEQDGWIECSDLMPEFREMIFVSVWIIGPRGVFWDCATFDCDNQEWWTHRDVKIEFPVTHWMPLPQPPRES